MTTFTICIADKKIGITALHESTKIYCKDYICEGDPDFSVIVSQKDIEFEREKSARENILEGIPVQDFSDAYLETLAVYRKISDQMILYNTLLFHGSVIAVDGVGYLFTAKSGTGTWSRTP